MNASLEERVARLEAENAELRSRLDSPVSASSNDEPAVTRRALLRRVGGAAVAGAGIVAATGALKEQPASADVGTFTTSSTTSAAVQATNTGPGTGVYGIDGRASGLSGTGGVVGDSHDDPGVIGLSVARRGVWGVLGSATGFQYNAGVFGDSHDGSGVVGASVNGIGVQGNGSVGLFGGGSTLGGVGVEGDGAIRGTGVSGHVESALGNPATGVGVHAAVDVGHDNTPPDAAAVALLAENAGSGPGVKATSSGGIGVQGIATAPSGVRLTGGVVGDTMATGVPGVAGVSSFSTGVHGVSGLPSGIAATAGVVGDSASIEPPDGSAIGVAGLSVDSSGVMGVTGGHSGLTAKAAVVGDTNAAGVSGVAGTSKLSTGVYGIAGAASGVDLTAGVIGDTNTSGGIGVAGLSVSGTGGTFTSTSGAGVFAQSTNDKGIVGSSSNNIGVRAHGGLAPLLLDPGSTTGPPGAGSHSVGEIYLDAAASVFVCTATGTPGTWQKLAFDSGGGIGPGGFVPLNPTRVCDTRANTGPGGSVSNNPLNVYARQTMQPFSDLTILVAGPIGPSGGQQTLVPANARAVVLNLAVVNFSAAGNFTVYPADVGQVPTAANLNWPDPQSDGLVALSNSVTVRIGHPSGDNAHAGVKVHNASSGTTDAVIDLAGYYA